MSTPTEQPPEQPPNQPLPDQTPPDPAPPPASRSRRSSKVVQVASLLLATLVAGWLISGIVWEREARQAGLRADFAKSWGPEQVVRAPLLVIPYVQPDRPSRQYLKIAPETLSTRVALVPERKARGLFSATVYTAEVGMAGRFPMPSKASLETLVGRGATILWTESLLVLQASDLAGMTTTDGADWDGQALPWRSCGELVNTAEDCQGALLVARLPLASAPAAGDKVPFQATVTLRGTGAYRQILKGRQVEAAIAAPWPTPSFTGTVLPSDSTVTDHDFAAHWRSVDYSQPPLWTATRLGEAVADQRAPSIGVDLLEAVPTYRMINRASKYGILFVVLSFTVYALVEVLSALRIHTIQYGLLGLSMTLFPLLLVSIAEPLGYTAGYWIGAALVLLQASIYTAAVTRRAVPTLVFAAALGGLFGFLYVLLSLETYSLLVGSVVLFLVLSVVMAVTQRVDWRAREA
ncbi:cell envelope integrity protein CreD [Azospirillum canadense]|uniref:cell envelope integrity protein CreD n=1 Tax=Azospirillum canadense TaxID=403962 RepID=UPI002227EC09|nr:cell envelope integrity protein CreD [Azospirillum canadense]MCW2237659.1 inner membrane protein [Azospirillum canadense]